MEDRLFDLYNSFIINKDILFDLYIQEGLTWRFVVSAALSAGVSIFFYNIYDHPNYQATKHFIQMLFLNVAINTVAYMLAIRWSSNDQVVRPTGQGFLFDQPFSEVFVFSLQLGLFSVIFFLITSLFAQRFSNNCSTTPIRFLPSKNS